MAKEKELFHRKNIVSYWVDGMEAGLRMIGYLKGKQRLGYSDLRLANLAIATLREYEKWEDREKAVESVMQNIDKYKRRLEGGEEDAEY